jgi:cAMP-dependent protein kinase regulator
MFCNLDEHEMEVVIDAMGEKRCKATENIILEGDKGDELYVLEEGVAECFK